MSRYAMLPAQLVSAVLAVRLVLAPLAVGNEPEGGVARSLSPAGMVAAKSATDLYYRIQPADAEWKAGTRLALLPGAALRSANGAVTAKDLADYDASAAVPILDTALTLNAPQEGTDLDVTLDRGRVELRNTAAGRPATVVVRLGGEAWSVVLESPGSRVAVDVCGRWPAGTRLLPQPTHPGPVLLANLFVLEGAADVKMQGQTLALKAPRQIAWDSVHGPQAPRVLMELPPWANAPHPHAALLEAFRQLRTENANEAIARFLAADELPRRQLGIVALGANDDLRRLLQVLGSAQTLEEWNLAVTVLRHWLGRGPGQDQRFLDALRKTGDYTEAQARIILQLLFGFSAEDARQPETYEVLIDYLLHEQSAIRALAAWHLARLVPPEQAVPYVLNATAEQRQRLYEAWKNVIPTGELPRR